MKTIHTLVAIGAMLASLVAFMQKDPATAAVFIGWAILNVQFAGGVLE